MIVATLRTPKQLLHYTKNSLSMSNTASAEDRASVSYLPDPLA